MESIVVILVIACCIAVYCIPIMIASEREHPYQNWIFTLNLLLGWTGIVWVMVFIWAVVTPTGKDQMELEKALVEARKKARDNKDSPQTADKTGPVAQQQDKE